MIRRGSRNIACRRYEIENASAATRSSGRIRGRDFLLGEVPQSLVVHTTWPPNPNPNLNEILFSSLVLTS